MFRYLCDITPTDALVAYTTDIERPLIQHMALVSTNGDGQKISVLLTRDAAIQLNNQLNDFILNGHR